MGKTREIRIFHFSLFLEVPRCEKKIPWGGPVDARGSHLGDPSKERSLREFPSRGTCHRTSRHQNLLEGNLV